jgi:hypothetical protein
LAGYIKRKIARTTFKVDSVGEPHYFDLVLKPHDTSRMLCSHQLHRNLFISGARTEIEQCAAALAASSIGGIFPGTIRQYYAASTLKKMHKINL